jgi:hypothetical protein
VTQLETKLAREKSDRAHILQSLEEERVQVAALEASHSGLLVKCQDLQAQHDKLESQLRSLQEVETSVMLRILEILSIFYLHDRTAHSHPGACLHDLVVSHKRHCNSYSIVLY